MTTFSPLKGSPCDLAVRAIRANGKALSEATLAQALDVLPEAVADKLAYPLRIGVIRRSLLGQVRYYGLGDTSTVDAHMASEGAAARAPTPKQAPVAERPAPRFEPPPETHPPARICEGTVRPFEVRQLVTLDDAPTASAPAPLPPIEIPRFLSAPLRREPIELLKDAAAVVEEATGIASRDVDRAEPRTLMQARELLAAAMPILEVRTFECANYSDGRLLLEIDGVPHILPAHLAARLPAQPRSGLAGREHGADS